MKLTDKNISNVYNDKINALHNVFAKEVDKVRMNEHKLMEELNDYCKFMKIAYNFEIQQHPYAPEKIKNPFGVESVFKIKKKDHFMFKPFIDFITLLKSKIELNEINQYFISKCLVQFLISFIKFPPDQNCEFITIAFSNLKHLSIINSIIRDFVDETTSDHLSLIFAKFEKSFAVNSKIGSDIKEMLYILKTTNETAIYFKNLVPMITAKNKKISMLLLKTVSPLFENLTMFLVYDSILEKKLDTSCYYVWIKTMIYALRIFRMTYCLKYENVLFSEGESLKIKEKLLSVSFDLITIWVTDAKYIRSKEKKNHNEEIREFVVKRNQNLLIELFSLFNHIQFKVQIPPRNDLIKSVLKYLFNKKYIFGEKNDNKNNDEFYFITNISANSYLHCTMVRTETEILRDNIVFSKIFRFLAKAKKCEIEPIITSINNYFRKLPKALYQLGKSRSFSVSFENNTSANLSNLDPLLISCFIKILLSLFRKAKHFDEFTRMKEHFLIPIQLIDDNSIYYTPICEVAYIYSNEKIKNFPALIANSNRYMIKLIKITISISIFCNHVTQDNKFNALNRELIKSFEDLNKDELYTKCLQIDNPKVKRFIMQSYTTTSNEDIVSYELKNFIANISEINWIEYRMENSFANFFFFVFQLFLYHYKNEDLILPLENKFVIYFAFDILYKNVIRCRDKDSINDDAFTLNASVSFFIINMSTIPSFTSLFLENDNYVCIIRDILRIQNESCYNEDFIHVPVEKCWTIWTIVNANNIINKDFPCYKGVSLRMLTHIADLLMNIKYYPLTIKPGKKEVENGALNDIIAKIKEEYVTVAKILKSLIDSNIKNGYDYLIRVVCEALPEMKEYLMKKIIGDHRSIRDIIKGIIVDDKTKKNVKYIKTALFDNESYYYILISIAIYLIKITYTNYDSNFSIPEYINKTIEESLAPKSERDQIEYQLILRRKIYLFFETLSFDNLKYIRIPKKKTKASSIGYNQNSEIIKQHSDFNLIFGSILEWISSDTKDPFDEYETFKWSDVLRDMNITKDKFKFDLFCDNSIIRPSYCPLINDITIMRNEETEQNIKMRTYLLSAFLRCVYDQLTFKVDEPNVVEEGEIEKIKKKFKKMLQTTNTFKKILLMVNTCVTANSFNITNLAAKFLQISSIILNEELIILIAPFLNKIIGMFTYREFYLIYQITKILMKIISLATQRFVLTELFTFELVKKLSIVYLNLVALDNDVLKHCDKNVEILKDRCKRRMLFIVKSKLQIMAVIKFYIKGNQNMTYDILYQLNKCIYENSYEITGELLLYINELIYYKFNTNFTDDIDIIFSCTNLSFVDDSQDTSSDKVLVINKKTNCIEIDETIIIRIESISTIRYFPMINQVSIYDESTSREYILLFDKVSDSFDFSKYINSKNPYVKTANSFRVCYYRNIFGFARKVNSAAIIDDKKLMIREKAATLYRREIFRIQKIVNNTRNAKIMFNFGGFEKITVELRDDISFCYLKYLLKTNK